MPIVKRFIHMKILYFLHSQKKTEPRLSLLFIVCIMMQEVNQGLQFVG